MRFRRFVYLVMNDTKRRDFPLRRIDTSHLFFPKGVSNESMVPPPLEDVRLPPPAIRFSPPSTDCSNGAMEFMLLGGNGRKRAKVVAIDHTGRCVMYDPILRTIRTMPELTAAKFMPASLAVGDDLYIIDTYFNLCSRDDCFDGLVYDEEEADWDCGTLPPPPYAHAFNPRSEIGPSHITSYAVVGGGRSGDGSSIWVSKKGLGTHSFDIASSRWTKAGDWVLPFWGPGKYIPEHKLWFGILADKEDGVVCASDLTEAPLTAPRMVWRWRDNPVPLDWKCTLSFLVHLGHSRFCLARFFRINRPDGLSRIKFMVLTGIEVERCDGEEKLHVRKHRCQRYSLENQVMHWVL
ncbi:uncharacterized protein LOC133890984 [Phragmites australis]|uniref:uncharacterized protein LOC133890984 n=1 Tax=Phragmites australis TaxID=29695 RepID=UPI002D767D92|nr:uncharacterized protein LOC133890984 [Phragmites australis]